MASQFVRAIPGFCQPISSLSHLLGAGAAMIAAVPLVRRAAGGNRVRMAAVAIYAASVILTLAISGTYHALERGCVARDVMQRIDHYAIWLLIAGTFTAVHGVMCEGIWRSGALVFAWSYAAVGILLQIFRFDLFSGVAGLVLYLGFGWTGVISIFRVGRQIGFRAVRPIWYAGIAYSVGAVLEAVGRPTLIDRWVGPHEMFHLAVIVGVALHWLFIRRMLMPAPVAATLPLPNPVGLVI